MKIKENKTDFSNLEHLVIGSKLSSECLKDNERNSFDDLKGF